MGRWVSAFAVGIVALGLSACSSPSQPSAEDLTGAWQMVWLQPLGQPTVNAPTGVTFSANFGSDGRVSLRADCNTCNAGYTATDNTLAVSRMACTLAACPSAPLDTQFAGLVQSAQWWGLVDDQLELSSEAGRVRLRR